MWEGEYLLGETYGSTYRSLADRCGRPSNDVEGYGGFAADMGGGLWLARMINPTDWETAWAISQPVCEGLVLKRPAARLEVGRSKENNGSWMIRCRKATNGYRF